MKINVSHILKLANLTVTNEEKQKFEKQLEETLSYIENLNEVDTTGVEPTSQVTGLEIVTHEDVPSPSLSQREALSNTKSKLNGFVKVKAILE